MHGRWSVCGVWNFDAAKWFLNRAVREADFGKVADNRINSRDALQSLYDRYGYRIDAKRIDSQIERDQIAVAG